LPEQRPASRKAQSDDFDAAEVIQQKGVFKNRRGGGSGEEQVRAANTVYVSGRFYIHIAPGQSHLVANPAFIKHQKPGRPHGFDLPSIIDDFW
jgi:hypothetical protein